MTQIAYSPATIARQFVYVREVTTDGGNHGQRVNAIQKWCGGQDGESWCMYFATMVLDICFQGDAPIPREGSCEAVHQLAAVKGWIVETPAVGDLVLTVNADNFAHHVGIITSTDPLASIAGNTSQDGVSSNGDRVAEHEISPTGKVFIRYPLK